MCRAESVGPMESVSEAVRLVKLIARERGLSIRSLAFNGRSLHAYLVNGDGTCVVMVVGTRGGRLEVITCGCRG